AEGKRQVAQAEAENAFATAMADLHRDHLDNYAATLAALGEAKSTVDQNSAEFAEISKIHDAAKKPADTRPLFEARASSYATADRDYHEAVREADCEHLAPPLARPVFPKAQIISERAKR